MTIREFLSLAEQKYPTPKGVGHSIHLNKPHLHPSLQEDDFLMVCLRVNGRDEWFNVPDETQFDEPQKLLETFERMIGRAT